MQRRIGLAYNHTVLREAWPEIGTLMISVGVATMTDGDTEETLLEKADKALYYSKQHGRNRITRFNEMN